MAILRCATIRGGLGLVPFECDDAAAAATIRVRDLKARCGHEIDALGATDYKQRNAALGLLSAEETDAIKATIQACRAICDGLEAQVAAIVAGAGTDTEKVAAIDAVVWP